MFMRSFFNDKVIKYVSFIIQVLKLMSRPSLSPSAKIMAPFSISIKTNFPNTFKLETDIKQELLKERKE